MKRNLPFALICVIRGLIIMSRPFAFFAGHSDSAPPRLGGENRRYYFKFFLKNSSVRSQADFAAASS